MKTVFAIAILVVAFASSSVNAVTMYCNRQTVIANFSDYFFLDMGDPKNLFLGKAGEVNNYAYHQEFRTLKYEKTNACKDRCYTIEIAAPLPYHRARKLTILPAPGFDRGIYRMETEYRAKPNDPWRKDSVLTCIVEQELIQK